MTDNKAQPINERTKAEVLPFAFFVIITDKSNASLGEIEGSLIIKIGAAKYLISITNDVAKPKMVNVFPIAQTEDAQ